MTEGQICPECGFSLPKSASEQLCPRCLLGLGVAESPMDAPVPTADSIDLPEKIGAYEVIEKIASGGMGVVVRARQTRLDREVAVKIIREDLLATEGARKRFRIEAEAAASLRHPNIVTVFEADDDDGKEFFSMELVDGHPLDTVLAREGPLEPRRAARILASVADAVHHAHGKGLLHRDIKPGNILLEPNDEPRVTDFGIVLHPAYASVSDYPHVAGTPAYMAPEQARGRETDLSPAADVYGLGAVLYELLVGQPPHRADSADEVLMRSLEWRPERLRAIDRSVPRDLEAICLRCLEPNPGSRYQTAAELADDLRDFLAGKPLQADRGGASGAALRWLFHRPALSLTYVALTVFLANHWLMHFLRGETTPAYDLYHLRIHAIIVSWAVAATAMQLLVEWTSRRTVIRYLWSTIDVILLTAIVIIAKIAELPLAGPLITVYLIVIAGTGFRWRPGLTVYTTALSIAAVLFVFATVPGELEQSAPGVAEVLLPVTAMIVMGIISAALVKRMRVLAGLEKSRY